MIPKEQICSSPPWRTFSHFFFFFFLRTGKVPLPCRKECFFFSRVGVEFFTDSFSERLPSSCGFSAVASPGFPSPPPFSHVGCLFVYSRLLQSRTCELWAFRPSFHSPQTSSFNQARHFPPRWATTMRFFGPWISTVSRGKNTSTLRYGAPRYKRFLTFPFY